LAALAIYYYHGFDLFGVFLSSVSEELRGGNIQFLVGGFGGD
jgi:hypothetical protein